MKLTGVLQMRKEILMMGLAGLLGCDKYDISQVQEDVALTKPAGCEMVKDIRLEQSLAGESYQFLCNDKEKNLVLFHRYTTEEVWHKISTK